MCLVPVLLGWLTPSGASAGEEPATRVYLTVRYGGTVPGLRADDSAGLSLGVDLGRFLSVELAADFYELVAEVPRVGTVGEYGVMALAPQLRVRYPLFGGQLAPYLLAGVGIGVGQFNDRKPPGFGLAIHAGDDVTPLGVVGGGIEYFLADNLALGLQVAYVISGAQTIEVQGRRHPVELETLLATASLRVLYPEREPRPAGPPRGFLPARVYLGVRIGGAVPTRKEVFSGLESRPEAPAWGGTLNQVFGVAVGADLGRYLGFELPLEGYEMNLAMPGRPALGEYALYPIIPLVRLRSAWLDEKLELYGLGGGGITYGEFNDGKPAGASLEIRGRDWTVAGALGVGLEYFVTSNVAIGLEAKYVASRGHHLRIDGRPVGGAVLDSVLVSFGLRAFLGELGQ